MDNHPSHDGSQSSTLRYVSSLSVSLSDEFLNTFIKELDSDEIVGIALGGSHARDDATPYSDVDILCLVQDVVKPGPKRYTYQNGHLMSIATKTIADLRRDFTRPESAFITVPSTRTLRILLDKDGSLARLIQDARDFTWEPLQEAANVRVRSMMMISTEVVHKMLGILLKEDALAFSSALTTFPLRLAEMVVLQRGILITSDSTRFRQVWESIGLNSAWTQAHLRAISVDPGLVDAPSLRRRGSALLNLYRETVILLCSCLSPTEGEVVEQALRVIDASGFVLEEDNEGT